MIEVACKKAATTQVSIRLQTPRSINTTARCYVTSTVLEDAIGYVRSTDLENILAQHADHATIAW
jgi:hypothetical protein